MRVGSPAALLNLPVGYVCNGSDSSTAHSDEPSCSMDSSSLAGQLYMAATAAQHQNQHQQAAALQYKAQQTAHQAMQQALHGASSGGGSVSPTGGYGNGVPSSDSPTPGGPAPPVSHVLTIRLLMQGKEVGSIIGKGGGQIKLIRDESGAKINISDGTCPERIVTITGTLNTINKAFDLICTKFHDDMSALPNSVPKPPITMRMIVPATQCGSVIGKGGCKIKEIREATGASIQVASEMLPQSTERAVTLSGDRDALVLCMKEVCDILMEAPPKGSTLPYRPKPTFNPLLVASTAAAAAAQQQLASLLPMQQMAVPAELAQRMTLQQHQQQQLMAHAAAQQQQQYLMAAHMNPGLYGGMMLAGGQAGTAATAAGMAEQEKQQMEMMGQYAQYAAAMQGQSVLMGAPLLKGASPPHHKSSSSSSTRYAPY